MAFDKPTRNRLASFVSEARNLIANEFTQQFQSVYGISEKGENTPLDHLREHLDDVGLSTATLLRERIEYLVRTHPREKEGAKAAMERLAREQAFTILNRLAALRMAEKRDLIVESVGKGYQSKGFKVFEQVAGSGLGDTYGRYRRYLYCLFDELAVDLGVLFDRSSPQGLLFPREPALLDLLKLLNAPDIDALWTEDETIGWIYQYYNDPAERKKMREAGPPRNSRELAVRNQFFTPRYVVEFLTDNTVGRIWYEMTQGETRLKEQCRYLVRRSTEIFLKPDEAAPEVPPQDGLSQEELFKQPVYIPHRPLKDPREIRMLDPACGSMHFGLYAFDLFEAIYDEAWEIAHGSDKATKSSTFFAPFLSFTANYPDRARFLADVPHLIMEYNIHGIDIDPRCAQIAGLSLWLRAQKSWQLQKVAPSQRPRIRKSNIVCAEPMPGDKAMLREFVQNQFSASEQPAFSRLLETIFDKMQLAGEAGSLLKIEEEVRSAVNDARKLWEKRQTKPELFSTEEINRTLRRGAQQGLAVLEQAVSQVAKDFWETVEERIYAALRDYAEQTENGGGFQCRLFAEDTARGFAFIDVCRKRFDIALMNPPFGQPIFGTEQYLERTYEKSKNDVLATFIERGLQVVGLQGFLGAITARTGFFLSSFRAWREDVVLANSVPRTFVDLGHGVMDTAMVDGAAYTLERVQ